MCVCVLIVKSICGGREGTGREGREGGREGEEGAYKLWRSSCLSLILPFYTFTEYLEWFDFGVRIN